MKKLLSVLAAMALVAVFSVPVYATGDISTEDGPPPDEEIIVVYDWETGQPASTGGGTGTTVGDPIPIDIRMEMVGEVPYITRYYEFESELSLADVPRGFEQDGYRFSSHDSFRQETPATVESRETSKTEVIPCETNDVAKLLETAERNFPFEENGFSGTLVLDASSIRFEEGERSNYGYTLTETREYPGLPANDAAYIDKTITKNGVTLHLDGIEWEVTGTSPADGALVPSVYKGIATYSGRATGSKVSGYTATLTYTGQVSKTTPGSIVFAVVYRGEVLPAPIAEVAEEKQTFFLWLYCMVGILALGGIAAFITVKKRNGSFCTDGRFGDIWEGRDVDFDTAIPEPTPEWEDEPIPNAVLPADTFAEPEPVDSPEEKVPQTAASILAAIEGMEETPAPRARKKALNKKEAIPLVEKVEDEQDE